MKEKIKTTELIARKWISSVDAHPPNDDPVKVLVGYLESVSFKLNGTTMRQQS